MTESQRRITRREVIHHCLRGAGVLALGGGMAPLLRRGGEDLVWQIDPVRCVQCGKCATECVLDPSAVKAVHQHEVCGYCELCFGYFQDQRADETTAPQNLRCPTDAIRRSFVEDPYYQYDIEEDKCIGCGLCVKGCTMFGNGSLILQVRHDRCLNCNECSIARKCPAQAFRRVPAREPYLLKAGRQ